MVQYNHRRKQITKHLKSKLKRLSKSLIEFYMNASYKNIHKKLRKK